MNTKLDKTNREILEILTNNGRASYTKISEQLSFSDTGVRKRLSKLNEEGILKIQVNLSLDALNFKACLMLLEIKNRKDLDTIIKRYESCPYVFLTLELLGSFNLLIGIYGCNIEDLDKKLKCCGPLNLQGVLHSKIILISNFQLPKFLPLKIICDKKFEEKNTRICEECNIFKNK